MCVVFCAITPCNAFFDTLCVSLSHFTCSVHPSERKGAVLAYHNIKKNEFKEYIDDALMLVNVLASLSS